MNEIGPQQLLHQIRAMHAELQSPLESPTDAAPRAGFGNLFSDALDKVNAAQMSATSLKRDFETGVSDTSLAEVMIAGQKADLSFRAMTEVRNKLVNAYQEIMNMPV